MATKAAATTKNVSKASRSGPAVRAISPKRRPVVRRPQTSKKPNSGLGPSDTPKGGRLNPVPKADKLLNSQPRRPSSISRNSTSSRDSTPSPSLSRPPGEKKKVTFNAILYEYDSDGSSRGQSIDRQPVSKRKPKSGPTALPTAMKPRDLTIPPEFSEVQVSAIESTAADNATEEAAKSVAALVESRDVSEPVPPPPPPSTRDADEVEPDPETSTAATPPPQPPLFEGALPKGRFELSRLYKSRWKERFLRLYPDRLEYGKWNRRNPRSKQFGRLVLRKGSPLLLNASMEVTVRHYDLEGGMTNMLH